MEEDEAGALVVDDFVGARVVVVVVEVVDETDVLTAPAVEETAVVLVLGKGVSDNFVVEVFGDEKFIWVFSGSFDDGVTNVSENTLFGRGGTLDDVLCSLLSCWASLIFSAAPDALEAEILNFGGPVDETMTGAAELASFTSSSLPLPTPSLPALASRGTLTFGINCTGSGAIFPPATLEMGSCNPLSKITEVIFPKMNP